MGKRSQVKHNCKWKTLNEKGAYHTTIPTIKFPWFGIHCFTQLVCGVVELLGGDTWTWSIFTYICIDTFTSSFRIFLHLAGCKEIFSNFRFSAIGSVIDKFSSMAKKIRHLAGKLFFRQKAEIFSSKSSPTLQTYIEWDVIRQNLD